MSIPLTVDPACPNTVIGPRYLAMCRYREHGVALWVRANGSARLFYRDSVTGKMRQRTWARIRLRQKSTKS